MTISNTILTIVAIAMFILLCYNHWQWYKKFTQLESQIDKLRKQSVDTSRKVLKGKITEQILPLMYDCPYILSDMRFIGSPIDYIVFDGYTDAKDDGGEIREVILLDVKTGQARLSQHQRKIRDAVLSGRVTWKTLQIGGDSENS